MPNIVIDPIIATLPYGDASRQEVELWLENLNIWLDEAFSSPFIWFHYAQASNFLEANGQFPGFQNLRNLQRRYGLDINFTQMARKVNDFFRDDTRDLESQLENLEFIIEPVTDSILVRPKHFITRLPEYMHDCFSLLLVKCCACSHLDFSVGKDLLIATLALSDTSKLVVSAVILDAVPDFVHSADKRIEHSFSLLVTPDDLLPWINVTKLWAEGESSIMYVIKQQLRHVFGDTFQDFRLGSYFVESVNKRGLDKNEVFLRKIIRASVDIVAGNVQNISGYHLHPFRVSEAGDSAQLVRDTDHAKAWRLMLQSGSAGWRLHYWQIPTPTGSIVEFANVGKESEREIL